MIREPSDHLSRLAILNLNRKVHCVQSQLRGGGVRIDAPPGHTIQMRSLYRRGSFSIQQEAKFLPERSRRVSFVANSILFNVNQPNPKPMTMPICSLVQLLRITCLFTSQLASCDPPQIRRSGSLSSGSLRGSLSRGSLGFWITPWWIAP